MNYSEENIFEMYSRIALYADNPVQDQQSFRFIQTPGSVWPNLMYSPVFDPGSAEDEIGRIKDLIRTEKIPAVMMCSPENTPRGTIDILKTHARSSGQWMAMSLSLGNGNFYKGHDNLEINMVHTGAELDAWCNIVNEALMGGAAVDRDLFGKLASDRSFSLYLGVHNGEPVSTCLSFDFEGKTGLYLIATLDRFRGKGFGTAITTFALDRSYNKGIREAHLQATKAGEPVYAKIGFSRHSAIDVFNLG